MKKVFVVWMALSSVLGLAQVPTYVPTDGLVGWWPLTSGSDNVAGVDSGLELIGDIQFIQDGGTSYMRITGSEGGATSYVDLTELPVSTEFTVFFRARAIDKFHHHGESFFTKGVSNETLEIRMPDGVDVLDSVYLNHPPCFQGLQIQTQDLVGIGSDLEWTDFCLTLNDTLVQFFIDGDLVNVVSCDAFASLDANMGLATHWWPNGQSSRFVADYQHLLVWDRGLTHTEFENFYSDAKGCTDPAACNYNAQKILHDGSCGPCEVLQSACLDGTVWDADLAGCIPVLSPISACGEGTVWSEEFQECVIVNPSDTDFDGCVSMTDLLDLLSAFGTCNEIPWSCGDPLEYQGYDYETVQIGEQCWFAENLRAENYWSGDVVPSGLESNEWESLSTGASTTYGQGDSGCNNQSPSGDACDELWSLETYGLLYNWFAVDDDRGICPSGWHVPSDSEWADMEVFIGMEETEVSAIGDRGVNEGTYLKSTTGWALGGSGTDSFGLNAFPGGFRDSEGGFFEAGADCYFFTSSNSNSGVWSRSLAFDLTTIGRYQDNNPNDGFSVRCIQDSEQ